MRYRKHTCRLVENTVKTIVVNKKLYITKEEIDGLRMQLRFTQLNIIGGNNLHINSNINHNKSILSKSTNYNNKSLLNSYNNIKSDYKNLLTLRKLIDMRFNNKSILNNSNNIDMDK